MNYQNIKSEAELRVIKRYGVFKVEYKNPDSSMFVFFTSSFDHLAAENEASRISKIIHKEPKAYKTENHFPRKREKPEESKDWDD